MLRCGESLEYWCLPVIMQETCHKNALHMMEFGAECGLPPLTSTGTVYLSFELPSSLSQSSSSPITGVRIRNLVDIKSPHATSSFIC